MVYYISSKSQISSLFVYLIQSRNAPIGSDERHEAREELRAEVHRRKRIDGNVDKIRWLLFGHESNLKNIRPQSQSLVDDWSCFKTLVSFSSYELNVVYTLFDICWLIWILIHWCRWQLMRNIVGHSRIMECNTHEFLPTCAMLGLPKSEWLQQQLKLVLSLYDTEIGKITGKINYF